MIDSKILIVGFSGAGKTYLLDKLIEKGETGDDLDQLIVSKHGFKNSREMIQLKGIEYFREREFETLKNWLDKKESKYLSLGGGAITKASIELINNRHNLSIIHVNKSFDDCWIGLTERGDSYLIDLGLEQAQKLFQERLELYIQLRNLKKIKSADDYLNSHD